MQTTTMSRRNFLRTASAATAGALAVHAMPPWTAALADTAGYNPDLPYEQKLQLLETFDAGQGQQYILYGTDLPYVTIVDYYKKLLRTGGNEIFRAPAMHRFDLSRFDEDTMAYPPSIVIKDYTWNGSPGYLHVNGSTEKRYRTVIQVVPVK